MIPMDEHFDVLAIPTFIHNVLNTVPGRDKVLKIFQYSYSFIAWRKGFHGADFALLPDSQFSPEERNAMSIQNTRRLFKIARFIGEWERIQTAINRSNELLYYPEQTHAKVVFIQIQMALDLLARLLSGLKSVLDDVLYFSRIGVFNPAIHRPLEQLCPRIGIPVILIDMFLNSLKLIQFVQNASTGKKVRHRKSFSLLARYEINEKRKNQNNMLPKMLFYPNQTASKNMVSQQTQGYPMLYFSTPPYRSLSPVDRNLFALEGEKEVSLPTVIKQPSIESVIALLKKLWTKIRQLGVISYYNSEIMWCWVLLLKSTIDLIVGFSYAFHLKCVHRGHITLLGIISGVLGVARIGSAV